MLANSGPLRTVSPFLQRSDSPAAVSVRLTEPLWHVGERTELLVHCVQCHMLLEREAALAQDETGELYIEDLCERNSRLRSLLDGLGEAARAVQPGSDPLPLLEETGLSSMCPVVAHLLGDADEVYRNDTVFLPNEYLDHVVTVNQLACTAKQLRRDVLDRQFKYCAHKIALLYHAVNLSKVKRDMLRKRIEEHFEDIKVATESTEAPQLGLELVSWVVELCDEIAATIREVPPSIVSKLEPLLPLLQPAQSGRNSSISSPAESRRLSLQ